MPKNPKTVTAIEVEDTGDLDPRLAMGGNQPPAPIGLPTAADIAEMTSDELSDLRRSAAQLHAAFGRMPTVIPDAKVYALATTFGGQIQEFNKKVDKARKDAKRPYLDAGAAVDAVYDLKVEQGEGDDRREVELATDLKAAHKSIKDRLSAYDTEQYRIESAKRAAEVAQLAEDAAKDGIVIDTAAAAADLARGGSVRSEHGGLAVKQVVREFTVQDPSLVPAQYCSPDPAKIRAAIEAGATSIPGVVIEERISTHVKRS